jgi:hypothetical protein
MKKWMLNLTTLSLTQVIKFDLDKKGVLYFESANWRDANKFVNTLLTHQKSEQKKVSMHIEQVIEEILNFKN